MGMIKTNNIVNAVFAEKRSQLTCTLLTLCQSRNIPNKNNNIMQIAASATDKATSSFPTSWFLPYHFHSTTVHYNNMYSVVRTISMGT